MTENGESTNATNDAGNQPDTPEEKGDSEPKAPVSNEPEPKEKTQVEKVREQHSQLKEANDGIEAEMLRSEQLKAKASLAGSAGGRVETPKTQDEVDVEAAKVFMQDDE